MAEHRSNGHGRPSERHGRLRTDGGIRFLLRAEEQILPSTSADVPLPELLNRICNALDCEIGNVFSLVSLLDDDTADFEAVAGTAKQFGLHKFCSIGVFAANQELLGTLEMYSCKPGLPSSWELNLVKRAGCLAAIAIERGDKGLEDADAVVAEMRPVRKRLLEWSKTVN